MADDADETGQDLEAATDEAIAACEGDARSAVRALLVVLAATEAEVETLKVEVARIGATVSLGYVRENLRRRSVHGEQ